MIQKIAGFQTTDGSLFLSADDARQHEIETRITELVAKHLKTDSNPNSLNDGSLIRDFILGNLEEVRSIVNVNVS